MREIHVNYYGSYNEKIPTKYQQKYPLPIRRNRKKLEKSNNYSKKFQRHIKEHKF